MDKLDIIIPTSGWSRHLLSQVGDWMKTIRASGKKVPSHIRIVARRARRTRTDDQNSLYWAWMREIAEFENAKFDRGWKEDDAHIFVKAQFFVQLDEFEELMRILKAGEISTSTFVYGFMKLSENTTTTESDTIEFSKKMESIQKYYEKKGLFLKFPDEPTYY